MELYKAQADSNRRRAQPLAARMRPRTLDEFVGQQHFMGPGKLLRRMIEADRLGSLIFYGPPGTGKTALANLIARLTHSRFHRVNAVSSGIGELRALLGDARHALEASAERTILFIDEIHRFNRTQQDVLLPDVEEGVVTLIGATSQNPFFAINGPLLSRSQIFDFQPLSPAEIGTLLRRALEDGERGLGAIRVNMDERALDYLAAVSDGDARRALTALEVGVLSSSDDLVQFTLEVARESVQRKAMDFDPSGDSHYDLASAFIKSMRGSDVDAAIYWLARMLESGEDPRFIARRMVIFAAEDVGNADPQALILASAMLHAVEFVGQPECQLPLVQVVAYLALAPKSNASTMAITNAREDVRTKRTLQVPNHLRDASYPGAESLDRGAGYQYPHDFPAGWVGQVYLPEERAYYQPVERGFETELARRLEDIRRRASPIATAPESKPKD